MDKSNQEQVIEGRIKSFTFDTVETEVTTKSDSKSKHNHKTRKLKGFANTATIDRGKDLVMPDAFKNSIEQFMNNPVMFYNHDWEVPIGTITNFSITNKGLFVEAEIAKDFDEAEKAWKLIEQNLVKSFSIGFRLLDSDFDPDTEVTIIKDLELLEVSVVTIPMNADSTFVVDGKNFKSITIKGEDDNQVTYKQMLASQEPEYDFDKAELFKEAEDKLFKSIQEMPDNSPQIQQFSFQEGDCSVCDEADVKGLSWAVTATGQELLICLDCFVKQDEDWTEEYSALKTTSRLCEETSQLFNTYREDTKAIIESVTEERDKLIAHVKDDITSLAKEVANIVK